MKDTKYIVIFVAIGLVIAYVASGPLRKPANERPQVGTPLQSEADEHDHDHSDPNHTHGTVYVRGTVSLGKGIALDQALRRPLFITAKSPAGGPPIAAKKMAPASFPVEFVLSSDDNMAGIQPASDALIISARLDQDGVAGPKQPGDWATDVTAKIGQAAPVQIEISK